MTADEIFTTTALNRADSERIAVALLGAPEAVVLGFRAMLSTGCYSVDEMVERITALKVVAK